MNKKLILVTVIILSLVIFASCSESKVETLKDKIDISTKGEEVNAEVTGSFVVTVRDIIPDYCLDDVTPQVAVVTQFQCSPFIVNLGEELSKKIEIGKTYVFEIVTENIGKIDAKQIQKNISPVIAFELYKAKVNEIRLAKDDEKGLSTLSIELRKVE